jgi:hypothetical protein
MRKVISATCVFVLATVTVFAADNWPNWRGPSRNGVSTETNLPTTWSATTHIDWKLPLPAYSGSTPIIWGDRIFLNVATAANSGTLELWAVDRSTKSVAWKRPIAGGNHSERKQNMSSPSPVTDGTQGTLVARHSGRLRPLRPQLGLRVVSPAARWRVVRAGAARHEDRRPVIPIEA